MSRNSQDTERRPLETKPIRSTTNVGFQLEDALTEYTSRVLSRSVRSHLLYEAPSGIGFIWFSLGTRNIDQSYYQWVPVEDRFARLVEE